MLGCLLACADPDAFATHLEDLVLEALGPGADHLRVVFAARAVRALSLELVDGPPRDCSIDDVAGSCHCAFALPSPVRIEVDAPVGW